MIKLAGDPVVITPQQQSVAPQTQARADDGYIYPADGSSNEARYPAPNRRVYDARAYEQQQPQQQYYDNRGYAPAPQGYYQPGPTISSAGCSPIRTKTRIHGARRPSAACPMPAQPLLTTAAERPSRCIHLDNLHHAEFLMVHHVAVVDEAPGEIQKARAERHASLPRHDHRIAPVPARRASRH